MSTDNLSLPRHQPTIYKLINIFNHRYSIKLLNATIIVSDNSGFGLVWSTAPVHILETQC